MANMRIDYTITGQTVLTSFTFTLNPITYEEIDHDFNDQVRMFDGTLKSFNFAKKKRTWRLTFAGITGDQRTRFQEAFDSKNLIGFFPNVSPHTTGVCIADVRWSNDFEFNTPVRSLTSQDFFAGEIVFEEV